MHILLIYDQFASYMNYIEKYLKDHPPGYSKNIYIKKLKIDQLEVFLRSQQKIMFCLDGIFLILSLKCNPFQMHLQKLLDKIQPKIIFGTGVAFQTLQFQQHISFEVEITDQLKVSPNFAQFCTKDNCLYQKEKDSLYLNKEFISRELNPIKDCFQQSQFKQCAFYENKGIFKGVSRYFLLEDKQTWTQIKCQGEILGHMGKDPGIVQLGELQYLFAFEFNENNQQTNKIFKNFIDLCWEKFHDISQEFVQKIHKPMPTKERIDLNERTQSDVNKRKSLNLKINTSQRSSLKMRISQIDPNFHGSQTSRAEKLLQNVVNFRQDQYKTFNKFIIRRMLHPEYSIDYEENQKLNLKQQINKVNTQDRIVFPQSNIRRRDSLFSIQDQ